MPFEQVLGVKAYNETFVAHNLFFTVNHMSANFLKYFWFLIIRILIRVCFVSLNSWIDSEYVIQTWRPTWRYTAPADQYKIDGQSFPLGRGLDWRIKSTALS
jgi:hypothetical protein